MKKYINEKWNHLGDLIERIIVEVTTYEDGQIEEVELWREEF